MQQIKTQSAGALIVNQNGQIALVDQKGKSWSFPKGHRDTGEDLLATAKREIYEETGLTDLTFIKELVTYERLKADKDQPELKQITLYLCTTSQAALQPVDPDNPQARWVELDEVSSYLHDEHKQFFLTVLPEVTQLVEQIKA